MASPSNPIVIDSASSPPPVVAASLPAAAAAPTNRFDSVWDHFERGEKHNTCTYRSCKALIKVQTDHSTSNMLGHLRNVHGLKLRRPQPVQLATPAIAAPRSVLNYFRVSPSSSSSSSSRPPPTAAQKRQWTGELLQLVVEMNVSFRAVTECAVLRQFMRRELQWEMPSRTALRRLLPLHYAGLMANLRTQLRDVDSISITTDSTFLTRHQVPYICITGHWIDSRWELHHTVLAVFLAEQGENGAFIATRLREVLEGQLGLSEKLHCVVTDEGKNFLSAVTILKQMEVLRESLRCACHRIQLTVKSAMAHQDCRELMNMVNKCQTITLQFKNGWMSRKRDILRKYQEVYLQELRGEAEALRKEISEHKTRQREADLAEREKLIEDAEAARAMEESQWRDQLEERAAVNKEVSELSLTAAASSADEGSDSDDDDGEANLAGEEKFDLDALADRQLAIKDVITHICQKKALVQAAATRWMTHVAVVERTLMWRSALRRALEDISADSSFRKKRSSNPEVDLAALRISDDEAIVLEQFHGIGKSCRKTLLALEADNSPTIGSLLYHHSRLLNFLLRAANAQSLDSRIQRFCQLAAANCSIKFTSQFDQPALIGAVLDPRFRRLSFLSAAESGKCKDALARVFEALVREDRDDAPLIVEQSSKRRRKGDDDNNFNFNMDEDSPSKFAAANELQRYLALPDESKNDSALEWWKEHAKAYPQLARLARRYLAIPASSASSERFFSRLKLTATAARQNLKPETLCMLLFVGAHYSRI